MNYEIIFDLKRNQLSIKFFDVIKNNLTVTKRKLPL